MTASEPPRCDRMLTADRNCGAPAVAFFERKGATFYTCAEHRAAFEHLGPIALA